MKGMNEFMEGKLVGARKMIAALEAENKLLERDRTLGFAVREVEIERLRAAMVQAKACHFTDANVACECKACKIISAALKETP